jgi:CheY-like chemotaxis protein
MQVQSSLFRAGIGACSWHEICCRSFGLMGCLGANGNDRRILVVVANENFRRTLTRILCRCGYEADTAANGEEALRALDRDAYDLVLSEVMLPGVACGLTVLCNARQHGRSIPFILLTECETERLRWIVSGVDGVRCMKLPVDVDRLKQLVASSLGDVPSDQTHS